MNGKAVTVNLPLALMSFGRPPSISTGFQVTPPDRGSFPLDHYGQSLYVDILAETLNGMQANVRT
jgi:cytochrome c oxidase assembly protein subunit 19